jgi:hypothetical protein
MSSKNLDTKWFDLKRYDPLKEMPIEGWAYQLMIRTQVSQYIRENSEYSRIKAREAASFLQMKPVTYPYSPCWLESKYDTIAEEIAEGYDFTTSSVNSLTSLDLWKLFTDKSMESLWSDCREYSNDYYDWDRTELHKIVERPHNISQIEIKGNSSEFKRNAFVLVDLGATDEQIKKDFDHWLKQYRKSVDYHIRKKTTESLPFQPFTKIDFERWIRDRYLPYIDLELIAQVYGKEIKKVEFGKLLLLEGVSSDRIRQTKKFNAMSLIDNEIYAALSVQIINDRASNIKNRDKIF